MKLRLLVAALVAVGAAAGLSAQDKKNGDAKMSIEDIMVKAHKTKTGLRSLIEAEIKKGSPDWAGAKKNSEEFVKLADALVKLDPPKGDKKGWEKLSKAYAEEVKELDKAVGKKDAKAVTAANKKLGEGCAGCHDAHRP
jgi:cytochrome c556